MSRPKPLLQEVQERRGVVGGVAVEVDDDVLCVVDYWQHQAAPGRTVGVTETKDVTFSG